jgi:NADPH2:quinone reductase
MKAAVYYETGEPDVFRYEEVPDPVCGPRTIVIRIEAISIEGGDVLHRAGGPMAGRPHIVGYQCAGTIIETGEGVSDRHAGQRVVITVPYGSHAEKAIVGARGSWLVPDGMDIREAACIPIPFGTADDCLFEFGHLQPGETVLIQGGGGGVGLAAIQLAKRAGATVLATASSDEKLKRLREFGMDTGINYRERELVQAVQEATGGRGVDLVVDPVGTTLQDSLACLAYRGRCITVGNMGRADRRLDISNLSRGNQTLTGVFLGAEMATERVREMIARHIADVAAGKLRVVIDRSFPLSEAAAAHAYIESRSAFGRVLLIP